MFARLTGPSLTSKVCQLGLVSAGATCDMLMFHLARKRQRARSHPFTTMQQQVQPDSVKSTSWGDQLATWAVNRLPQQVVRRMDQLPHRTLVMVLLIVFVNLGRVSRDVRLRRRRHKLDKKNWEEKSMLLSYTEQDEPEAENCWSIPGNDWRRTTIAPSTTSPRQSSHPVVPAKALMPKHPVASTDDEHEDEDSTDSYCRAAPGSRGIVAQQTAKVESVLQFFRMSTEGQLHLEFEDEEGLEQQSRERQVVPDGFVRSYTLGLERKIQQQQPLMSKSMSLPFKRGRTVAGEGCHMREFVTW